MDSNAAYQADYYWGKVTSNIDWCELNYIKSRYIAEFWNSISSFVISLYAIYGIYLNYSKRSTSPYHIQVINQLGFVKRLNIAFFFLFLVGIGSVAFHATLLYENQLFDELPMIYTALIMLYIMVTVGEEKTKNGYKGGCLGNSIVRHVLPYFLVAYGTLVTVCLFVITTQPKILQISYGILVFYVVFHSIYLLNKKKPEGLPKSHDGYLYKYSFVSMLTAYVCWLVERFFCNNGTTFGLELHSCWHILSGLGVFVWTQFLICKLLEAKHYSVGIKHFIGIPHVYAIKRF
ncbi:hypothetical protein DICPUDRAFT_153506 [Dictyostelium purpureum]|uniref:Alkaline dihydroceramidase n=1 Tax=Dictyostelium purpureum TaxID=5786 RepID=F0ZP32_DICPU|nr:uncharacterized protein DICPUDRAFT_153506 [Dictyostelium purpureum]EGC34298.1 hypothetical protein DICPUDRAFT_153506 [Dictyostelium purpureum]|eukprot:XP_003289180.1 hypothetical protein DICPUDRAFT_153506 [Dictyostelium purpureum]